MLASSTGYAWRFVLPLLSNCRHHHCLVSSRPLFGISKPSFTARCLVRIKNVFRPMLVISTENFRKTSTSVLNCGPLKSSLEPLSCYLSSSYVTSPAVFWKSLERRHSSTDSTKEGDKFQIAMAISILKELKHAPTPALILGFSGLIPFVSLPILMFMSDVYIYDIALAQACYGAVILSFLGGIRWGSAITSNSIVKPGWTNLGQSVLPSLVAWLALLLPCPVSTLVLAGGFTGLAYYDMSFPAYVPWFKALRLLLSSIVVLALCTDMLFYLTLKANEESEVKKKQVSK